MTEESHNELHAAELRLALQVANMHGNVNVGGGKEGREPDVPRQVPTPPASFVDRETVLEWISAQFVPDGQRIIVVTGVPGSGKSAVVRRWAHEHRDWFPGGQLYLNRARFDSTEAMVASALRSLGETEQFLPVLLGEQVNLLRTRTSSRATLVVVDDAEDAVVRLLLPSAPGSVLLVTAAADLGELWLDGAAFCELSPLSETAGVELLGKMGGSEKVAAEPTPAASLVRLCAGLPIAIVVLAAKLARMSDLTVAELAAEFERAEQRLDQLEISGMPLVAEAFDEACARLPEPARQLYSRLGVVPFADFGEDVLRLVGDAAQAGTLTGACLLEPRTGGRYGLHDLVRQHARQMFDADGGTADDVLRPLVEHYLTRAAYADRALMEVDRARAADYPRLLAGQRDPFTDKMAARTWLDRERANLVTIVATAAESGWDEQAWQLAEALTAYYYNSRRIADWTTVARYGIRAAERCGNATAEVRLRLSVSRAYCDLQQWDIADQHLDTAMAIAAGGDNRALLASAWEFRGRYLEARGEREAALTAYQHALDLDEAAGERRGTALVTFFAARCRGDLAGLRRSAELLREADDTRMAARALLAVGTAEAAAGETTDAIRSLRDAISALNGTHYAAEGAERLAAIAEGEGDQSTAREFLRAALDRYESVGHPRAAAIKDRL